jgi:hypothetical protein
MLLERRDVALQQLLLLLVERLQRLVGVILARATRGAAASCSPHVLRRPPPRSRSAALRGDQDRAAAAAVLKRRDEGEPERLRSPSLCRIAVGAHRPSGIGSSHRLTVVSGLSSHRGAELQRPDRRSFRSACQADVRRDPVEPTSRCAASNCSTRRARTIVSWTASSGRTPSRACGSSSRSAPCDRPRAGAPARLARRPSSPT